MAMREARGSMNQNKALSNKTILITRPRGREKQLCSLIEQYGGNIIHYPVFDIQPPAELEIPELIKLREQLHSFTMAIFISPTAVEQSKIYFPVLPEHLTVVSIGSKTRDALERQNVTVDIDPPGHDSESLLKLDAFMMPAIQGQRVLIFRGNGGRALLGDTLVQRGAQIRYVETYRRELPPADPLNEQQLNSLDAITISSSEGLDNLVTMMDDPSQLIDIPLIVPSQRALSKARKHGFRSTKLANNATDEAILAALLSCFPASALDEAEQ